MIRKPGKAIAAGATRAVALALACVLAVAIVGCGGGGDSSSTTTSADQAQPSNSARDGSTTKQGSEGAEPAKSPNSSQPEPEESGFTPKPHQDSGGGSEQFRVKGGDNSVQEFGQDAPESELDKAAASLHGFLDARAAGDWASACSYLADEIAKSLQQLSAASQESQGADCGQLLQGLSKGVPRSDLAEAAIANVGSLRFEGERAFLIYRGAHGVAYVVPMERTGGAWKVAALSGTPLE